MMTKTSTGVGYIVPTLIDSFWIYWLGIFEKFSQLIPTKNKYILHQSYYTLRFERSFIVTSPCF